MAAVRCPQDGHEGFRVRKRGTVPARAGRRQRWECLSAAGAAHYFTTALVRVTRHVSCPNPRHADGRTIAKGTREANGQRWRRYQCIRATGEAHGFQVLVESERPTAASIHFPPACPEHPGSAVRMFGTYGKGAKQRQRYQCLPADGSRSHTFTPALSREAVEFGVEDCSTCEELLSPHRGALTGARHTPWTLNLYAKALNDLSLGESYAAVSVAMRERKGALSRHWAADHAASTSSYLSGEGWSRASAGKASWHLAADLVEQYAPLIYARAMEPARRREAAQRAANDALLSTSPGSALESPVTYILDDLPVFLREGGRLSIAWSVLAVVEVLWRPGATPADPPARENRLRLARAYPSSATAASWQLVLGELERPDFLIADASRAIDQAVKNQYAGQVALVPSLYHAHRAVRDGVVDLKGTTHVVEGRAVPLPQLAKHLDVLTRDELLHMDRRAWARWWDDLTGAVAALGAPVEKLLLQRALYEETIWAGLQVLQRQPHLPASNAAIENRLRAALNPFLENRKHLFRNLARTNFLLDLAVARAQGAFGNLDDVVKLLRSDNERHGGWAPAPRAVTDPQPPHIGPPGSKPSQRGQAYSSLRNRALVPALLAQRTLSPSSDDESS